MNMIEKVAKAIHEATRQTNQALFDDCNGTYKNKLLEKARAAIEAMREPTDEMMAAGVAQDIDSEIKAPCVPHWYAMINAALKE